MGSDAVRRRLATAIFLYILGASVAMQVYPKVVLEHFDGDDAEASRFNGWVTFGSSIVQLLAIPSLSGASDIIGRRPVLVASVALHGASVLALGFNVDSLVWVTICQVIVGVCGAVLPVSQAIIVDLSRGNAERGEVARGLGLIGSAFGLAIIFGPVLGGSLSEDHRSEACFVSASLLALSVLSCYVYGWKETAPEVLSPQPTSSDSASSVSTNKRRGCSTLWVVNPFSVLKVFLVHRTLLRLAVGLFLFNFSLNVFSVWYNYFDFKFHWSALDIAFFFSAFGVVLALTTGLAIRFLVPQRLSEERAVVLGLLLQGTAAVFYCAALYGWMMYIVMIVTSLQFLTEPCMQSIMARLVDADRQGSLQGAVMTLRVLAAGLAAPAYGQVFAFGVSDKFKKILGVLVPGLPLLVAATCSFTACAVAWCSLSKTQPDDEPTDTAEGLLDGRAPTPDGGAGTFADENGLTYDSPDLNSLQEGRCTLSINESEAAVGEMTDERHLINDPTLRGSSSDRNSSP